MTQALAGTTPLSQPLRTTYFFLLVALLHAAALWFVLRPATPQALVTAPLPLQIALIALTPEKPQRVVMPPAPQPARPLPAVVPAKPVLHVKQQPHAETPQTTPTQPETPAPEPEPEPAPAPPAPPIPSVVPKAPLPIVPPQSSAAYLDNPKPPYPAFSKRLREEGRVLLRVYVNADGSVSKVSLVSSSGFERLDRSALDTVPRWRFVPARQGDSAVAAAVIVPIAFNLKD